jgi:hypothetical protein
MILHVLFIPEQSFGNAASMLIEKLCLDFHSFNLISPIHLGPPICGNKDGINKEIFFHGPLCWHLCTFATLDMSLDTHRTGHTVVWFLSQCFQNHLYTVFAWTCASRSARRGKLRMPRRKHSSVSVTSLILIDCLLRFASLLPEKYF